MSIIIFVFESRLTIAVVFKVNLVNNMTKWIMDTGAIRTFALTRS